jgi:hypothetical protein
VDNLKRDARHGLLSGQDDDGIPHLLGFYFGMLHGSILSPRSGQLHPDVTELVTSTHPDSRRSYAVGQRDSFQYSLPEQRIKTDVQLCQELGETALDLAESSSEPET